MLDQSRELPGILEHFLEAALGHDLDSVCRKPVVAGKLFGIPRNRRRLVIEGQEKAIAQAHREDLTDIARASETLDAQHDISAKSLAME